MVIVFVIVTSSSLMVVVARLTISKFEGNDKSIDTVVPVSIFECTVALLLTPVALLEVFDSV